MDRLVAMSMRIVAARLGMPGTAKPLGKASATLMGIGQDFHASCSWRVIRRLPSVHLVVFGAIAHNSE